MIGVVAGAAFGAGCAGLGLWLGSSDDDEIAATTLAATDEPLPQHAAQWVRPGEALLGPTVLLPTSLALEDDAAVLSYDLADIAPPALGEFGGPTAEASLAPLRRPRGHDRRIAFRLLLA